DERAAFAISMSTTLLAMLFGWWAVGKRLRRASASAPVGTVTAGTLVAALLLFALVVPYRLLYLNKKERVEFETNRCYIPGVRPGDLLLYCPDVPVPKNRVVSASDPRVRRSHVIESIFTQP